MNTKFLKKASTYSYIIIAFITVLSIFLGYSTIKEPPISSKEFTGKVITLEDVKNNNSPSLDLVMSHVKNIAKTAHPSGSDAIIDVRNYITEQISKMGLKYEFQSFERDILGEKLQKHYEQIANDPELAKSRNDYAKKEGFNSFEDYYNHFFIGKTEYKNILVRVGPENPKHKFLMMAHYDSVKSGPGAGDDAFSVGSLLECMRILSLKKDLKNTVYFLITDGEELGMVGGEYFVKNPLFDPNEITMITNFEARGSKGVPFMYRSSENNKNLLKILSKNVDKKWTFSWLPEIFKIMPNPSDLGLFIDAGYRGLDFAMAQDFKNYHRPTDSFENLSVKSANQYLKMTSDFVNYFSNVEKIEPDSNENAVAFPVLNGKIMILSSFLMKIFGIAISVLGLVFLIFAFIKKKYKIKDFLICAGAILVSLSLAVLLFLFQNWLPRMFYWLFSWLMLESYGLIFISIISLAVTSLFVLLAKKFFKIENLSLKAVTILIFAICSMASSLMFNGASYIFSIPLLFILISALFDMFSKSNILNLFFKTTAILKCPQKFRQKILSR